MDKKEATKLLYSIIKHLNDFYKESTAHYNEDSYMDMFECKDSRNAHENWMKTRLNEDWTYGEIIDIKNKKHPQYFLGVVTF